MPATYWSATRAFIEQVKESIALPDKLHWILFRLTYFRNRIAHHEYLLGQSLEVHLRTHPLRERLSDIFEVLRMIDPKWNSGPPASIELLPCWTSRSAPSPLHELQFKACTVARTVAKRKARDGPRAKSDPDGT